ncbi:F0F1 ATP synthase subunit delta [Paracoccus suum]|uniref:ATP synthase subunit delta n=1 Tax=Paracoccus suum TaxID=2259340 RepID=A0A344PJT4_9RHOB|nr:F0F1 ATP synthase subunit delta [Paracoccus suum]AXC49639.1 F0F1 ATP synthase subunit delta [Paracoccus suum]
MAQSASISSGVAGRYAQALFDIARQDGSVERLSGEVKALTETLEGSDELRAALASPVLTREDQGRVVSAVAERMNLSPELKNTLALMAQNRRLFALPHFLKALDQLSADARGEVTAEVVTAQPLSAEQTERLIRSLGEKSGKTVKLNASVDESLIGGMIVKLGSKMIDTSVRSRLSSLQNTMKEVG